MSQGTCQTTDCALPADGRFFRELRVEFLIHELKDPLSVIETGLRMLVERRDKYGDLTPRQEKTLQRSLRNAQKARDMLYNLLEIGRSEAQCFDCCAFRPARLTLDVLADVLETLPGDLAERLRGCEDEGAAFELLATAGIRVEFAASVGDCEMLQDETKFRQITGNLLKNALHHRSRQVWLAVRQEARHLVLEVSDDGPGVRPEHRRLIFRRYAQVDTPVGSVRKGHGLGLAGALILARSLGGNIEIATPKGRGATFRLTLPTRFEQTPKAENTES
jgi:signal transduction histidine kinase